MDSVAVDIFHQPVVEYEGHQYNRILVCVCRASGYILAEPCLDTGLTAEKVCEIMWKNWMHFGIPSIVTSDEGPQFAYSWWQTLCALAGVRVAWSHPYHHQGNGRAESAGQQLQDELTRLINDHEEPVANWVELLPHAIRLLMDLPNPLTGISPYEYVHGRPRGLAGLPYKPLKEAIDAKEWFARQQELTKALVDRVNEVHKKGEQINRRRLEPPDFKVGDVICYHVSAEAERNKLGEKWEGPGEVIAKEGEHSYIVKVAQKGEKRAHRSQLQPHVDDVYADKPFPRYYFSGKAPEVQPEPKSGEYIVAENGILDIKVDKGQILCLVKWRDYETPTWQPLKDLCNDELTGFLEKNNWSLSLDKNPRKGKAPQRPQA